MSKELNIKIKLQDRLQTEDYSYTGFFLDGTDCGDDKFLSLDEVYKDISEHEDIDLDTIEILLKCKNGEYVRIIKTGAIYIDGIKFVRYEESKRCK